MGKAKARIKSEASSAAASGSSAVVTVQPTLRLKGPEAAKLFRSGTPTQLKKLIKQGLDVCHTLEHAE